MLKEKEKILRREVREFADRELLPLATELESNRQFPKALFSRIGELGYLDLSYFNRRETALHNTKESMIILEEIARGLPSMTLSMSPHVQCMNLIAIYGTESLKKKIIPACLNGSLLLGFALSEAGGGSDALGIDTVARRDGDGWVLNGEKCWITNLGAAGGYVVAARSANSGRSRDVSLFYVDAAAPGLDTNGRIMITGMNNSPVGNLKMQNCRVPFECLIGKENDAYPLIKILLNEGRLDMAALAVGIAQGAMECAVQYTSRAGRYGRTLSSYQGISFPVAKMYEKIFVARSCLYHVADMCDAQEKATMEVAALKLFTSEMCCEVCKNAMQVHGARGMQQYSDVERYFRDAQMLTIGEGSSEVCQIVISGKLYHADLGEQY